tara:strand:- start:210 stop:719 length:510 start_codon:yes stop_codon:yes gene_type:complete
MKEKYFKHDTCIIDDGVEIGEGTKVWAFTHICKGAKIGKNCVIGEKVYIGPGVTVGDNSKIQNNALIYEGVTIEDDVFIGPNVVTTNDLYPRVEGDWKKDRFLTTRICRGASVGANSTIICGVTLFPNCMVGAGSVVTHDVDDDTLVMGVPGKPYKYLDKVIEKHKSDK